MPDFGRTVCLEFYGTVAESTPAIVEVRDFVRGHPTVELAGLAHIDWRSERAVGYRAKLEGRGMPKMVLLADIVSADEADLDAVAERCCEMARARGGAPSRRRHGTCNRPCGWRTRCPPCRFSSCAARRGPFPAAR